MSNISQKHWLKKYAVLLYFQQSAFDTFIEVTHYWLEKNHACLLIILFTKFVALIGLICKEEVGNKADSSEKVTFTFSSSISD